MKMKHSPIENIIDNTQYTRRFNLKVTIRIEYMLKAQRKKLVYVKIFQWPFCYRIANNTNLLYKVH